MSRSCCAASVVHLKVSSSNRSTAFRAERTPHHCPGSLSCSCPVHHRQILHWISCVPVSHQSSLLCVVSLKQQQVFTRVKQCALPAVVRLTMRFPNSATGIIAGLPKKHHPVSELRVCCAEPCQAVRHHHNK